MIDDGYSIERLSKHNLKDIEILYEVVHNRKPAKNYFLKKYNTAYTGVEYIGCIAYQNGNIPVTFFGITPCFIQHNQDIILSGQASDAMTHPLHRHKGLFEEVARASFELCRASGVKLLFGFPNQNSYHGLVHKLEWKETGKMDRFTIPVKTFPWQSLMRKVYASWLYRKYTHWILRKYFVPEQSLSKSITNEGHGGLLRNEEYLKYKMAYSDSLVIKTENTKVWIRIQKDLIVGDMDIEEYNFYKVVDTLIKIARQLGLPAISFQTSPGTKLHALLMSKYKPIPSFPVIFLDLGSAIPLDEIKFTFADIDIF